MRIRNLNTDQVAKKYTLEGQTDALYHVWPYDRPRDAQGRKSNENKHAVSFETVESAATHLIANPRDQIRMQPGHALINQHVAVEIDGEEPEPHRT